MHPAAKPQFERIVHQYRRWRQVPEKDRPRAPAWWWGPAFELRNVALRLPLDWSARLDLASGASYADGAEVLLKLLAGQIYQPCPYDFSRMIESTDSDVRDCTSSPQTTARFRPDPGSASASSATAGCSGGDTKAGAARNSSARSRGGSGLLNKNPCISSQA